MLSKGTYLIYLKALKERCTALCLPLCAPGRSTDSYLDFRGSHTEGGNKRARQFNRSAPEQIEVLSTALRRSSDLPSAPQYDD